MEGPGAATGRRLLVLGAGPAQLGLLASARERGLFVIALDRDPAAPGFQYADRRAIISTEDEQGIERLADAEAVEGIIAPGIDWPVGIAARVAERHGLPHPIDAATASLAVSKQKQRERLAAAGVPQPSWQIAKAPDEALEQTGARSLGRQGARPSGSKGSCPRPLRGRAPGRDRARDRRVPQRRGIVEELVDGRR